MAWILLLLAIASFLVPFFTTSAALGAVCLLAALVMIVISALMFLAARVGGVSRSEPMLSAEELRLMSQIAERRAKGIAPATEANRAPDAGTAPPQVPSSDA